jgi:hypothetical protein
MKKIDKTTIAGLIIVALFLVPSIILLLIDLIINGSRML